ncbi:MAG TPA: helix-turn-helix transcriptional regulator, partial [Gallicola sp.]|nr:helix-turn-helix transcriptional regulator [Gallicola sp.]
MSSIRDPEKTKQKILRVSRKLFMENGYDNTSIQDIIDGLGGMTKGAIYHHFKSKQDILETLINFEVDTEYKKMKNFEKGKTGLEKIKIIMINSLNAHNIQSIIYSAQIVLKSPRMIGEQYLDILNMTPEIEEYIEEGIEDGSITTKYPKEVAELLLMYFNLRIGIHLME